MSPADHPPIFELVSSFDELRFYGERVARAMGYAPGTMPEHFEKELSSLLAQVPEWFQPRCGYAVFGSPSFDGRRHTLSIGNARFDTGPVVAKRLRKSEEVAVFLATIGPEIEKRAHHLFAGTDTLRGFLLDTIGSELAERLCDRLEMEVETYARSRGWRITNRYSPGYCDWSVVEQQKLFSLFPADFCGVRLTESSLMIPIKSVSGIIGLGAGVEREAYECSICDMEDCIRRSAAYIPPAGGGG